jgi:uncharacterized protein YaaQ
MKLIIAIIRDSDNEPVSRALTSNDFRVTCIASTGGFLRRGASTLLIGLEDNQVDQALKIIRESINPSSDPGFKKATVFVLGVDKYLRF